MAAEALRFGVIGVDHVHVFSMVGMLREAGAAFAAFHAHDPAQADGFGRLFPDARPVADERALLEDPAIGLVVCAAVPDRRAGIAAAAMRHGKDVLVDKPAALGASDVAALERASAETGRRLVVFFSERLASRATLRALALVAQGAIGRPLHATGFGPHLLGLVPRPAWFWDPARAGGILVDLASHQIDQLLCLAGAGDVTLLGARTANRAHPEHPGFEDLGELWLRAGELGGYARVDWFTPAGLGTWGDGRLWVLGDEGTIEVRKNCDPAGRPGGDHLILVDGRGVQHIDCAADPLPFAQQLLADLADGGERAMPRGHALRVCALAVEAQRLAREAAGRG